LARSADRTFPGTYRTVPENACFDENVICRPIEGKHVHVCPHVRAYLRTTWDLCVVSSFAPFAFDRAVVAKKQFSCGAHRVATVGACKRI